MSLESATYINELITTNPAGGDQKLQGDDHIRMIKETLRNTFPAITGPLTPTHTELNYMSGVTSAVQTQLDSKAVAADTYTKAEADTLLAAKLNTSTASSTYANKNTGSAQIFNSEVRAVTFQINSGRHLKTNIVPLKVDRKAVRRLQLYMYTYIADGRVDTGVLADEVWEVFPTCVGLDEKGRPASVDYGKLGVHISLFLMNDTLINRIKAFFARAF